MWRGVRKSEKRKKKRDVAELNKPTETLDTLVTSDRPPPPTETVVWMPLSVELKELLESVPDLDELPSYKEMMEPLLPT